MLFIGQWIGHDSSNCTNLAVYSVTNSEAFQSGSVGLGLDLGIRIILGNVLAGEQGVTQRWEHSPLTNVAGVLFWCNEFVVGSQHAPRDFFWVLQFFSLHKIQHPQMLEDLHENQLRVMWRLTKNFYRHQRSSASMRTKKVKCLFQGEHCMRRGIMKYGLEDGPWLEEITGFSMILHE